MLQNKNIKMYKCVYNIISYISITLLSLFLVMFLIVLMVIVLFKSIISYIKNK